jgi:hypothetical protein
MKILHTLLTLLASAGVASAQLDVAIVASASGSDTDCRFTDPQAKLMATGIFNTVDIINVTSSTPTLAELRGYDAILSWSNLSAADGDAWGNVMADYIDNGGGVVVASFANYSSTVGRYLGGRWETGGYEVIVSKSGSGSGPATLGVVHEPNHPVMAGISSFDGGPASFKPAGTVLTPGSTLIAEWSDGKVLVAEGASSQRIDLGLYPPSSDCSSTSWVSSTDGALLLANALAYVAAGTPGTAYCFGDSGSGTPCPCNNDNDGSVPGSGCANGVFASGARLKGVGRASVSTDTLVLITTGLEPNNSGLYFQAENDLTPGQIWGDGLRCAGGQLKRLGVRLSDPTGRSDTSGYPLPISVKAGNVTAGDTKRYQCWYRNLTGSPCGSLFNSSNGYAVIWGP